MNVPAIQPAAHPEGVLALLRECGLPTSDLEGDPRAVHFERFLVCGSGNPPGGVAGLEVHGRHGLLRSLAVSPRMRGEGCGSALVAAIEARARAEDLEALYLLTETAERFFASRGYARVARSAVPAGIRGTAEFASICPDSAAVMCKALAS